MLLKSTTIRTSNDMMLVPNILTIRTSIMHSIFLWYTQVDTVQVALHGVVELQQASAYSQQCKIVNVQ